MRAGRRAVHYFWAGRPSLQGRYFCRVAASAAALPAAA